MNAAPSFALSQVKLPSTHDELTVRAERWLRLRAGCKFVMREVRALTDEIPDAIGWNSDGHTLLIECKATRSDFRCDKLKPFRVDPARGMGAYRYFMCPPGLIKPEDLPPRWGLLYCHRRTVTVEHGWHPRSWDKDGQWRHQNNLRAEAAMMMSALGRIRRRMGDGWFRDAIHETYSPFGGRRVDDSGESE